MVIFAVKNYSTRRAAFGVCANSGAGSKAEAGAGERMRVVAIDFRSAAG